MAAFRTLTDKDVARTACVNAFGKVFVPDVTLRTEKRGRYDAAEEGALEKRLGPVHGSVASNASSYAPFWRDTDYPQASGDINDFMPVFGELAQWRTLWLRPFM